MPVTISIYHAPGRCVKCQRMEEIARAVAARHPGQVEIALVPIDEAPPELGVIMPPTMAVGDTLMAVGGLPNKQDVASAVADALSAEEPAASKEAESSAFGQGRAVAEGDVVYVCSESFDEDPGCKPMLLFWYVDEGDAVSEGEELAEVESAKAVFVIESPIDAVLESILVGAGEALRPDQRLARLRPR